MMRWWRGLRRRFRPRPHRVDGGLPCKTCMTHYVGFCVARINKETRASTGLSLVALAASMATICNEMSGEHEKREGVENLPIEDESEESIQRIMDLCSDFDRPTYFVLYALAVASMHIVLMQEGKPRELIAQERVDGV